MATGSARPKRLSTGPGSLAKAPHDAARAREEFPPYMTTSLAAFYCGFRNSRGLHSAFRQGKVYPYGRRGGSGHYVWKRDDLDEFLRGDPKPANALRRDAGPGRPLKASSAVRRAGARERAQATADALTRVKMIAARGKSR